MRPFLTLSLLLSLSFAALAQQKTDSVSIGNQYANQVWYSLANGSLAQAPLASWDLAFEATGFTASVWLNGANGVTAWIIPGKAATESAWNQVTDTDGVSRWKPLPTSDTSWNHGNFNHFSTSDFDLGWGVYDLNTHTVLGDSLFLIKLADGSYRKLWIESLAAQTYTIKYAKLDGSATTTTSISKANFTNKNFAYFSLANNAASNPEPESANWDLLFTKYMAVVPSGPGTTVAYPSTGVLLNKGVAAVQVINVAKDSYQDFQSHTLSTKINSIGHTWKAINMQTFRWDIQDSNIYFIQARNGDIYKFYFTGFSGSSTGKYLFTSEKLSTVSIPSASAPAGLALSVASNGSAQPLITTTAASSTQAQVTLIDISGKVHYSRSITIPAGTSILQVVPIQATPQLYILQVSTPQGQLSQKILVTQ